MRLPILLASLLLPVAALAQAPSPLPPTAARLEPFRLGQLKVWTLQDGQISLPAALLKGIDPAEAKGMLGGKDAAPTPVNAYLVRMPGKTVLVDTGIGKAPDENSGHLGEQLAAAGVAPVDIDLVLITHFHFDHIGGLLKADGTRAFPKARLLVPRLEQTYWLQDPAQLPERFRERIPKVKAILAAYEGAGALGAFEDGAELAPGLRALAAHGHTDGHTVYAFTSEGRELWCLGDLIHFGAVQFARPEVGVTFDLDSPKAIQSRQDLFRKAAQAHVVLAGAHLPQLVRLEVKGNGYTAVPVAQP
jgi:glyoxylase-like metal-dependent hydrolase (beta-lactamase superfamily II)